ncbi:hypothetical protein BH09PLA1_BH09PLA1_01520 [soil metagenome]
MMIPYRRRVNSAGLNQQQVERLAASVKRMRHYLDVLTARMHQRYFPRDDPLKVAANKAFDAVSALMVEVERLEQQRH